MNQARHYSLTALLALVSVASCNKQDDPALPTKDTYYEDSALPGQTDPAITTATPGSPLQYAYWPKDAAARKDVLFIMIPGTIGNPSGYRYIQQVAASSGYYSLGIAYDNNLPVESQLGISPDDNTAANVLEEYLTGADVSPRVSVSRANSFENRIIKMILYMDAQHPSDNWKRFLTGSNTIIWEKLSVCGHSQGSDHCMYMSKKRTLFRAGFIGGPGDFKLSNGQYPGFMRQAGRTPAASLYGFNHTGDLTRKWSQVRTTWIQLGIPGAPESVDNTTSYTTHQLITSQPAGDKGHMTVVADGNTTIDRSGNPLYAPVWKYMNLP